MLSEQQNQERKQPAVDNNNMAPQSPQTPAVVAGPTPAPKPTDNSNSNKMVMWFAVGLVVIVVLVGGFYLLSARQQAKTTPKSQTTDYRPQTTAAPQPEETVDALDRDLQELSEADLEADFSSVDSDLGQL